MAPAPMAFQTPTYTERFKGLEQNVLGTDETPWTSYTRSTPAVYYCAANVQGGQS